MNSVKVIGAGLAGCEAALQLANAGIGVNLYEMKPQKHSPAHKSDLFAELVCSNSLKADRIENACGLLKEEMRLFGSCMMNAADVARVPAGGALAVDREIFSEHITSVVRSHPLINVISEEVTSINPDEYTVIATGPLTSSGLDEALRRLTGEEDLHFYDAAAPIVTFESINQEKVFRAARWGKGDADYINCPMTEEEYKSFYNELINAQTAELKEFEDVSVFEGCMPIEVMAKRGEKTLTFGPLKPVGLFNPKTDKADAYAVVQLRQDNRQGTMYNLVGFQTNLKWPEQKRVFSMIPGLENAEFIKYGVMHRNSYINGPKLLTQNSSLKKYPKVFIAGQLSGVEGYVESAASGIWVGRNLANIINDKPTLTPSSKTCLGALMLYISDSANEKNFQPMNANFGIIDSLPYKVKNKQERYLKIAEQALDIMRKELQNG